MSVEAFLNSLPPPYRTTPGERVQLLNYRNCAVKGVTHEVRQADEGGRLPMGIYWGSKKQCLQFMADRGLECVNLAGWGEMLPTAQLPLDA